jgi:hypothetical protein
MTVENEKVEPTTAGFEQVNLNRQSLLNEVFQHYHPLVQLIKKLPLAENKNIDHAVRSIDSGMLWIKEMLLVAPLTLKQLVKEEEKEKKEVKEVKEEKVD